MMHMMMMVTMMVIEVMVTMIMMTFDILYQSFQRISVDHN